jgi:hypothetical protein
MTKKIMKNKIDTTLKYDTWLKADYPNLGWTPTSIDLEETFHYFTSKYNEGLHKKSQDYYWFWGLMKYPHISKEEIQDGIELQPKKVSYN